MLETGKSYTVKNWFANKVAQEVGMNICRCDVFGVLKETEKAVYALMNLGINKSITKWVPKSVMLESPVGEDAQGFWHYETKKYAEWDEAYSALKTQWNEFN